MNDTSNFNFTDFSIISSAMVVGFQKNHQYDKLAILRNIYREIINANFQLPEYIVFEFPKVKIVKDIFKQLGISAKIYNLTKAKCIAKIQ